MEQIAAAGFGGLQSKYQSWLITPHVSWIDLFFDLVLSLCITSVSSGQLGLRSKSTQ